MESSDPIATLLTEIRDLLREEANARRARDGEVLRLQRWSWWTHALAFVLIAPLVVYALIAVGVLFVQQLR